MGSVKYNSSYSMDQCPSRSAILYKLEGRHGRHGSTCIPSPANQVLLVLSVPPNLTGRGSIDACTHHCVAAV